MAVSVVTDVALAGARAQAAADAAALAAAGATLLGPAPASPRAAAVQAARLHGARLLECCGGAGVVPPRIRVAVAVAPASGLGRALRGSVVRHAAASLRPAKAPGGPSGFAVIVPNSQGNGAGTRPRR
ncbi:MAG TPA: hypothetical protein VNU01_00490 [Egibacteraceae bacterium]|nr:hypothetical protein [Egibacteraceae bacterium]